MKSRRRACARFLALTLSGSLALAGVAPQPAWAGAPTDAMRDFFSAVNVVLTNPRTEDQLLERMRAIRRHVDDVFDFREAARLALGREWSAHTAAEQNEFVALFAELLERSFVWRVAGKAALGGGVKVQYGSETVEGDTATVETAIAARDGSDLRLDFRMVWRADRWVVRDVVMEGVSTMENYHAQFQRVVRDSSWRDLMGQLRAKVGATAVQVAAEPAPLPRPGVLAAGPAAPPDLDRSVDERQAIARDVAAVVTPGLASRDTAPLPPLRPPAFAEPERRVSPPPPPVATIPATVPPVVAGPVAALGNVEISRPARMTDAEPGRPPEAARPPRSIEPVRLAPPVTAALPAEPPSRPPAARPVVARATPTAPGSGSRSAPSAARRRRGASPSVCGVRSWSRPPALPRSRCSACGSVRSRAEPRPTPGSASFRASATSPSSPPNAEPRPGRPPS